MATQKGPSRGAIAWRQFVFETVVCVVLVLAIVAVWLRARSDLFAGTATVLLVGLILRILWRRE